MHKQNKLYNAGRWQRRRNQADKLKFIYAAGGGVDKVNSNIVIYLYTSPFRDLNRSLLDDVHLCVVHLETMCP